MFKVHVDDAKKLVKLEASGFFHMDEAKAVMAEFEQAVGRFKPKEAVLLTDVSNLKPSSAEIIPYIQKIQVIGKEHFKKFASIHASGIANNQLKRVADQDGASDTIQRFENEEEAMKYLFA